MTQQTTVDLQKMKDEIAEKNRKSKEEAKISRKKSRSNFFISAGNVIIGLWQVLVFASICFSTGIIFAGTDDITYKFLTVPAVSYALYLLISKFLKK